MNQLLFEFWDNFRHNLFQPLLLFFYMGFLIPLLKVPFEFPKVIYQGLTIYLLVAIGWHGGERLAGLSGAQLSHALGFMIIGFATNFVIGIAAYWLLRKATRLRQIDAAVVGGYYGSDSAGTFMTCLGVLLGLNATAAVAGEAEFTQYSYAPYMPVMLAVMEIPGCLVGLYIVSRLRRTGLLDANGNMPGEPGYIAPPTGSDNDDSRESVLETSPTLAMEGAGGGSLSGKSVGAAAADADASQPSGFGSAVNWKVLHEVFLNPGLYLLFGGIVIGFCSGLQGERAAAQVEQVDILLVKVFEGMLCLFLLEMGMAACQRLPDLRAAGWPFIVFGLVAPNVFAAFGICVAHGYSMLLGEPFGLGTYALFAVLCAAASYIAVPAVQRMAVPESSPTLPLAASLGLTFSYNVTIGIPVYLLVAKAVTGALPVA